MTQRSMVTGRKSGTILIIILLLVFLIIAVVSIIFLVAPANERRQSATATAISQATIAAEATAIHTDKMEKIYDAGIAFAEAGSWEEAVDQFTTLLKTDPSYRDTASRLTEAVSHVETKQAEKTATAVKAVAATEAAATVEMARQVEEAYQRGLIYKEQERWGEAKAEFEQVLALQPDYKDIATQLAQVSAAITLLTPTATATPIPSATPSPSPTVDATATAAVKNATATAIASQPIKIDENEHFIGYRTEFTFMLSSKLPSGALLYLDTKNIRTTNPIWINGEYIGSVPGIYSDWVSKLPVFVPGDMLKKGRNDLFMRAGGNGQGRVRNIILQPLDEKQLPQELDTIVIDDQVHHIGVETIDIWEPSEPEADVYSVTFELPSPPNSDGLLSLEATGVEDALPVRVNGRVVGNMPGLGESGWTPIVYFWVPQSDLQAGRNQVQIGPTDDDFLIRNVRFHVLLQ